MDRVSPSAAGPIGWAAGAEWVRESRDWITTFVSGAGDVIEKQKDVIGSFDVSFAGERDSLSPFLEVSLPPHEIWDVCLAGRYSDHDDMGSTTATQAATIFELSPIGPRATERESSPSSAPSR